MDRILILMSTYNGEKYLGEQLDSIFAQKDVDFHLLVRDDGSSDDTLPILHYYETMHSGKIEVIEGENLGWIKSFFTLVKIAADDYPGYGYFAFADQDDIWKDGKLRRALNLIQTLDNGYNLYACNLTSYKDGREQGLVKDISIHPSHKGCLIRNYATGCAMLFNRSLIEAVAKNPPTVAIAHDYWFYLVATLCGSVIIDPESYILYRQHDSNQIGCKRGFIEIWRRRLASFSSLVGNHNKENMAKELLRLHGEEMSHDAKMAVRKLRDYRISILNRIFLIFDNGYTFDKLSSDFWLKIRILFGKL